MAASQPSASSLVPINSASYDLLAMMMSAVIIPVKDVMLFLPGAYEADPGRSLA